MAIEDDSRGEYVNLVPKERTDFDISSKFKVKKSKDKKSKFLKKPKVKIKEISPERLLTKGAGHYALVKEGRTGYFNDEYEKEIKWLGK